MDATGMTDWEVNRKAVMLSYAYDEVLVERKGENVTIVCKGTKKMEEGRGR